MDADNNFHQYFNSILTFLGGSLGVKALEYWVERRKSKKYDNSSTGIIEGFDDISNIYFQMDRIIETTNAERVLLFKGSNGGGLPMAGSEFYTKAIHQSTDGDESFDLVSRFNTVLIDGNYANMLRDIVTSGFVRLKVSEMPDCLLKRIYIDEGVKYSEVYYLVSKGLVDKKKKFEIFYMSIATHTQDNFDNNSDRLNIQFCVDNIRKTFQKYKS